MKPTPRRLLESVSLETEGSEAMGEKIKIEWCDHTWSPWRGCSKVAAGCVNCFAERMARRRPDLFGTWGVEGRRVVAGESYWRLPYRWNRAAKKEGVRRRVFCGSMMDWLELRPELEGPRFRLLRTIVDTPSLDWILLSKRCENFHRATTLHPELDSMPSNAWLLYSASTQVDLDRGVPHLLRCPAAVRGLSLEPLLETIRLYPELPTCRETRHAIGTDNVRGIPMSDTPIAALAFSDKIQFVIIGGESGPGASPCDIAWIRSIRDQCRAAGVPLFVKQLGARPIDHGTQLDWPEGVSFVRDPDCGNGARVILRDPKGGELAEWPEDIRVREFPR